MLKGLETFGWFSREIVKRELIKVSVRREKDVRNMIDFSIGHSTRKIINSFVKNYMFGYFE